MRQEATRNEKIPDPVRSRGRGPEQLRVRELPRIHSNQHYVDSKTKALAEDEARQIADLKAQLADYQKVKEQAQAAVDQVSQNQKTIQDLQAVAKRVEGRLDQVPKEVIKQLIDALQAALNE